MRRIRRVDAIVGYSDAKECYYDAIGLASRLGLKEDRGDLENAVSRTSKRFRQPVHVVGTDSAHATQAIAGASAKSCVHVPVPGI